MLPAGTTTEYAPPVQPIYSSLSILTRLLAKHREHGKESHPPDEFLIGVSHSLFTQDANVFFGVSKVGKQQASARFKNPKYLLQRFLSLIAPGNIVQNVERDHNIKGRIPERQVPNVA